MNRFIILLLLSLMFIMPSQTKGWETRSYYIYNHSHKAEVRLSNGVWREITPADRYGNLRLELSDSIRVTKGYVIVQVVTEGRKRKTERVPGYEGTWTVKQIVDKKAIPSDARNTIGTSIKGAPVPFAIDVMTSKGVITDKLHVGDSVSFVISNLSSQDQYFLVWWVEDGNDPTVITQTDVKQNIHGIHSAPESVNIISHERGIRIEGPQGKAFVYISSKENDFIESIILPNMHRMDFEQYLIYNGFRYSRKVVEILPL